jgi:hypothetical protein
MISLSDYLILSAIITVVCTVSCWCCHHIQTKLIVAQYHCHFSITLVHRKEVKRKGQSIAQQVKVQAKDRVRLVSITSKNKENKS